MRWVWFSIALVTALVLAILAVGAMLPQKHTATRSITVHRPVDEVWSVLSDHAKDPAWRPDVESVTRIADRNGHPVWEEKYKNGDIMHIETTAVESPKKMVRKIVDQSMFGGVWTYEVTPAPDGKTTIKITEDGEVYNPAFRFIARFIIGNDSTLKTYLKNLAAKFGETAAF
jgi:hypothetical protein